MYQTLSSRGTATISRTDFDYGDVVQWQQLVFRLCLFHSLANARRAYGSEGWRVPYVFGPNDLKVHTYVAYAGLSVVPITYNSLRQWKVPYVFGPILQYLEKR